MAAFVRDEFITVDVIEKTQAICRQLFARLIEDLNSLQTIRFGERRFDPGHADVLNAQNLGVTNHLVNLVTRDFVFNVHADGFEVSLVEFRSELLGSHSVISRQFDASETK